MRVAVESVPLWKRGKEWGVSEVENEMTNGTESKVKVER